MPRPPKMRTVECLPRSRVFKPAGIPAADLDAVDLKIDELEAVRLKHCEKLDHETCAERMNVSRATFHRVLNSAYGKIADALTTGKAIEIGGGPYRLRGRHRCRSCGHLWKTDENTDACPECGSDQIARGARRRRGRGRGGGRQGGKPRLGRGPGEAWSD